MEYLAIQMSVLLGGAVVLGGLVGGWVARFIYQQAATACRIELAGLRRNYEDATRENVDLRRRLQQQASVLHKISTLPSDTEYGQFLQVRKTLEKTRLQYQGLLDQFNQQQQAVGRLRSELQLSQQELAIVQANLNQPLRASELPLPVGLEAVSANKRDDLTLIQGVSQHLAGQLRALGIVTYRQIAEFTADDMHSLQRLLGSDFSSPPEGWVQHACSLFHQKYPSMQA